MIVFILGFRFVTWATCATLGGGGACTKGGLPLVHVSGHSTHVAARPACPPWYQQQPLPSLRLDLVTAGPTHPRGQSCPTESETGQQRTGAPSFLAPPANELRLVHRGATHLPPLPQLQHILGTISF